MKRNVTKGVYKGGSPEEAALISNIESLLSELKGMGGSTSGDPADPQFQPGELDDVDKGGGVNFDGDEQGFDLEAGNRQDQDDGKSSVLKDIQSTSHDGYDATDPAEDAIFEDLPDSDMEDLKGLSRQTIPNEVKKAQRRLALLEALQAQVVAKSQTARRTVAAAGDPTVMKALARMEARQTRNDAILAEVLEGLGVSQGVGQAPARQVNKAARRPEANYQGANAFMEQLSDLIVQKSGGARQAPVQEQGLYGDPDLDALLGDGPATPTRNEVVQKSMRGFLNVFGQNANTWKT